MDMIKGKSAWDAETLSQDSSWRYRLTESDIAELDDALLYLKSSEVKSFLIEKRFFPLRNLQKKLMEVADVLEKGTGIFLLRGVPVHKYSYTDLKLLYAGLGSHLGTPVTQDLSGELLYEVTDKGKGLTEKGSRGTATNDPLPFHTDRSDVVGLLCIQKSVSGGSSWVVSGTAIHNEILRRDPTLLQCLYEPYYHARAEWESKHDNIEFYPLPVFSMHDGHFAMRYLRHFINVAQTLPGVPKMSDKQIEAINLIETIANDEKFCARMEFEEGDIQLLNNFISLHSRAGYVDDPARKRLLLRLWLSVPNSRPLNRSFSPLYYKTGAGEIRGGLNHLFNA